MLRFCPLKPPTMVQYYFSPNGFFVVVVFQTKTSASEYFLSFFLVNFVSWRKFAVHPFKLLSPSTPLFLQLPPTTEAFLGEGGEAGTPSMICLHVQSLVRACTNWACAAAHLLSLQTLSSFLPLPLLIQFPSS